MKLQTILDHLSAAEFSQLNFGEGPGKFEGDQALKKVLSSVNLGLTDLFGRFDLKLGKVTIALQPNQTSYLLTSRHSQYGRRAELPYYIQDTATEPFKDDVILIKRVTTDAGEELLLNTLEERYSLMTSAMDRLEVPLDIVNQTLTLPDCLKTSNLAVTYRANHVEFDVDSACFLKERIEVPLPVTHITALLYFVASRANNPVGLGQEFNAGNTYASKYELECARLKNDGMEIQDRGSVDKFHDRGFV